MLAITPPPIAIPRRKSPTGTPNDSGTKAGTAHTAATNNAPTQATPGSWLCIAHSPLNSPRHRHRNVGFDPVVGDGAIQSPKIDLRVGMVPVSVTVPDSVPRAIGAHGYAHP